jgi:hypothetical protein
MHRHIRLAPALVVVALTLLVALPAGARGFTVVMHDTVGDAAGAAPDIDSISIWNEEDGTISFQLAFANRQELGDQDLIALFIDTNGNLDDGSNGAEYALFVARQLQVLLRWNGTDFEAAPSALSRPDGLTVTLARGDLGGVDRFSVSVLAGSLADDESFDETGYGPFVLTFEPKLAGATMTVSPSARTLKVGSRVTARVVARLDDGTTAKPTTVACKLTLAGKAVKPVAPCAWKLPKAAKGKRVVVSARGTYKGKAFTTQQVVIRVR